ncbi:FAD/NAD(P)-binding domain-containing protein [Aspergillus flavus]|nr:FAD/NAD(P)-binding domain-containing protein [Aspergillus flavus]
MSSIRKTTNNLLDPLQCNSARTNKSDVAVNPGRNGSAGSKCTKEETPNTPGLQQDRTSISLISERPIDQARPLKLIYIGAGISGIIAAIQFRKTVPHLEMVIYEKNPDLGGTWYENKYPGCACDVPSHTYQLSFESWTEWSHFFSGSGEILEYWKRVAEKYDVRKHIRFNRRCIGACWNDITRRWVVRIEVDNGDVFEDSADVLMTGTGLLNKPKWPSIPGLQSFQGQLLHSASWVEGFDGQEKNVAVIGAGSSAIQIVPALVDKVKSMDHYIRGGMWISSQHGSHMGNFQYTEEEKQVWRNDPAAYTEYRKELELEIQKQYALSQRSSSVQQSAGAQFQAEMQRRLKEKPEVLGLLLPDFPPLCNRLTPAPGYLEALVSPKVNVIPDRITCVDETGIITADGRHRPVDAIVCATGFEKSLGGSFPILGRNGIPLRDRYANRPETYLGLCTDGFPNFFQSLGPNSFQGAGNLLIMIEQIHIYVGQVLFRMAYGNIGLVEPKRSQVLNFSNYAEEYFERTVYSSECNSWYKSAPPGATLQQRKRGRITALWPGSSIHAIKALGYVRWEDFETLPYDGNEFGWFGNGWAEVENKPDIDPEGFTWYLNQTSFLGTADENNLSTKGI